MPLETKILVGFRPGIVAVPAASLLFFRAKLQLVESTQRLSRTDEVPAELEGTFPSLKDIETGTGGFDVVNEPPPGSAKKRGA